MQPEEISQKLDVLIMKVETLIEAQKPAFRTKSEWMDKEEIMRILKCSERTLQSLRAKHKLSYTNPFGGSKLFYLRKEVESIFEKNFNSKI
jgi:hypothetical protein